MSKITKKQKEILKTMQDGNLDTIYIGYLGVEGLGKAGMCIVKKIRTGTAAAFIREGLAIKETENRIKLTELGKTYL